MPRKLKIPAILLVYVTSLLACLQLVVQAAPTYNFKVFRSESFDTGIPSDFNLEGSYTLDSVHKYDGTHSLLFVSSGDPAYIGKDFNVKPPFIFSIAVNVSVVNADTNFTRLELGTQYNVTLGVRKSDKALLIFINKDKYTSSALILKAWYNFTLSVDQYNNLLKVIRNGTEARSVTLGQIFPLYVASPVSFKAGILKGNGTLNIDAFRLKVSPVVYVTPAIESPQNVQRNVAISGDFFRGPLSIYLKYPTGKVDKRDVMSYDLNGTGDIKGFLEFMTLPAGAPAGTYRLNVTDTAGSVIYHFGAWNISSSTITRKEKLKVRVGGLLPGGSFTVTLNRSADVTLSNTYSGVVDANGEAVVDLEIPASHPLGTFTIRLSGTGTFDNQFRAFSTSYYTLKVEKALLNVTTNLNATLQRANEYDVRAYIRYMDGSEVPSTTSVSFKLYYGGTVISQMQMTRDAGGFWRCTVTIGVEAPISASYLAVVNSTDPYGNSGSWSKQIQVIPAQLRVNLNLSGENFSRRGYINATATVRYPSGTPVELGKVTVVLKSGIITRRFDLSHVEDDLWRGAYLISEGEKTGVWNVLAEAEDGLGNQGSSGELMINILRANLTLSLAKYLPSSVQRGSKIAVLLEVKYPDEGEVRTGFSSVTLTSANQTLSFDLEYNASEMLWHGVIELPRNLPPDVYEVLFRARDNYDNFGTLREVLKVEVATLKLNVSLSRGSIQSFFEELSAQVKVLYPDSSEMTDGHVVVIVSSGNFNKSLEAVYKQGVGWFVGYRSSPLDPQGTYRLEVKANDPYDNSGRALNEFSVSHLFFYVLVVGISAIVVISVFLMIRSRRRKEVSKRYNYIKYY
ncbi:MAG: hypothetical protein QXF26_03295 [Candidatus Bathyarchaeia archaeon]